MSAKTLLACTLLAALVASVISTAGSAAERQETLDPGMVNAKIEGLGLHDDLMRGSEKPEVWLRARRDAVMPELIAGLGNAESRIAQGCLEALDGAPESEQLVDALVSIAGNPSHLLRAEATWSLAQYADDPRVPPILEAAIGDAIGEAPDAKWPLIVKVVREKTANGQLAVGHFAELLTSGRDDARIRVTERLGDLGLKAAIPDLEGIANGRHWATAGTAYLALANIDPEGHGLTEGQKAFLEKVTPRVWGPKVGRPDWQGRARFDHKEIRPLLMRMLQSDYPAPALNVLEIWRDTEALPELMRIGAKESGGNQTSFLSAYVAIAGTREAAKESLDILAVDKGSYSARVSAMLHNIVLADMSADDRVAALRAVRDNIEVRHALLVPQSLRTLATDGRGGELPAFLVPLMAEENDLASLGAYCRMVVANPGERFAPQVQAALDKAAAALRDPAASLDGAADILRAADAYGLDGAGRVAGGFFTASDVGIRLAAARVAARLGGDRPGALRVLYEALASSDVKTRKAAAADLADVACADEGERAAREEFVLSNLGKPAEDYALRVLATCGGRRSVESLLPILDGDSVGRAIHAAWVLTQLPDKSAYQTGLRRLAVVAFFKHKTSQAGPLIHIDIAPDMYLCVDSRLRGDPQPVSSNPSGITIPPDLLVPFDIDKKEQAFAERVYWSLQTISLGSGPVIPVTGIAPEGDWRPSYEGLFRLVAERDLGMAPLFIEGRPVVDFPVRRAAAKIVETLTGKKLIGRNFDGLDVDLAEPPRVPYRDQDSCLARLILDCIQMQVPIPRPYAADAAVLSDEERHRLDGFGDVIGRLTSRDAFGESLKAALIANAEKRGMASVLKALNFSLWRDVKP